MKKAFAITAIVLCLGTMAFGAGVQYTVTPLGTLGGPYSQATGINASGQVVGWSYMAYTSGYDQHAFLYSGGVMHDLGTPGADSAACGINASGQVVGWTTSGAFLYDGTMHDLGTCSASGINASGQIVGQAYFYTSDYHAFLYDGTMHDLGTLGGIYSNAFGINASGLVVGMAYTSGGSQHAFLYDGTMHDLGSLGGDWSGASGINASGQVVGWAYTAYTSGYDQHAFLYSGGVMHDLGTPGVSSSANSINASGQVVGFSLTSEGEGHAFLYDGTMHDLNSLLALGNGGWTITDANAINDNGWIAATGYNPYVNGGTSQALLLTPVPEPATMSLLLIGGLAILRRRRK